MKIRDIATILPEAEIIGDSGLVVGGIECDSRLVKQGDLFVAISGYKTDGHEFVSDAIHKGASAVLLGKDLILPQRITKILVPDSRRALALLSNAYFDYPASKLKLIGITGTNGKTSTTYLLNNIIRAGKVRCGIIGTVEKRFEETVYENPNTTPESLILQRTLADMVKRGAKACVMEVSSHALELQRVEGIDFDIAVFTNLTHDHLDFHGSMESYFKCKATLFAKLKKPGWAVINVDDPYGQRLAKGLKGKVNVITYGLNELSEVRAVNYEVDYGIKAELITPFGSKKICVPYLMGIYNLYNLLAAIGSALTLGFRFEEIIYGLNKINQIPGRFQQVQEGQKFSIVIDYAHTPDGVQKVLEVANNIQRGEGKIITVLGAAGERDPYKRPLMGKIAAQNSDLFIITEQDSRSEDRKNIIDDIYKGAKGWGNIEIIEERVEAIRYALEQAQEGDIVLILGKGHEKTLYLDRDIDYRGDYATVKDYLSASSSPFMTS